MAFFESMKLLLMIGDILSRPGRVGSILHLSRLLKTSDDKVRRYVKGWEDELNTKLLDMENGKLELTGAGRGLHQIAQDLKQLTDQTENPVEVLRIEAEPLLAAS